MNNLRILATSLVCTLSLLCTSAQARASEEKLEQALSEVRNVKAALHSRESSVFGNLASPAEMAAQQMRCRPAPVPKAGVKRELDFDADTIKRAKGLNPKAFYQQSPRFGRRIIPLGITGAYFIETLKKSELVIVHVLDDSPAGGVLEVEDIIIGANGRLITDKEDPRPEMGGALLESQSPELGGILTLHVVRDKKPINVKIDLGTRLSYSKTWPMNCKKTEQIRRDALDYVLKTHPWDRRDFWTPTFLLASGDDAALELARRELCAGLQDEYPEGKGGSAWNLAYRLINQCEYYLITGDSSVLPAIKYNAECVSWAQYRSGSWSHGGGGPKLSSPGTADGGYGEINCAGLGAFVGLTLARQCGVVPYDHSLPRSVRFFGRFCGANFPYGLGNPTPRGGRMDNGMNSMAAIGFHLLGEKEMAQRWARTVCYMWMARERGHAEAIFSGAWGPVGAALAPKEEFHAFMNNMTWSYELGRARDGSIRFMRGGRWVGGNMTAAMGLFLYLPEKRLQILGGDSVFARTPPADLEKAAQLYKDKKWKAMTVFLNDYIKKAQKIESTPAESLRYAKDMLAAYQRLEKHAGATLKIIEKSIANGQYATASVQLDLLDRMMGEVRPESEKLRKSFTPGKNAKGGVQKLEPLVDEKTIAAELKLNTRGMDNGFACNPTYIGAVNKRGFEGMKPEQIARFFNCPSGSPIDGAVDTLVAHGEAIVPLLRKMLTDTHPGVRAGALYVLSDIYRSDSEEYRSEVGDQEAAIIKIAQPMTKDPNPLVRNAATGLMLSMRVINDDVINVLRDMAKLEGARIDHCVRYGIKDPVLRTELCMELINTANRNKSKVPSDYKPIAWAVAAHLDQCGPYVQTGVNTLRNPEVLMLYGFFSQSPPNKSYQLLFRYHDNPLVSEALPDLLRYSSRKRAELNHYWWPIVEYPHRIIIRLGPKAIPVVRQIYKEEAQLHKQIAEGKVPAPVWWGEGALEYNQQWCSDLVTTCELVEYLYGKKPQDKAIARMCEIYVSARPFGAWERQLIREHFTEIGPAVIPAIKKAVLLSDSSPRGKLMKQINELKAQLEAGGNKHAISRLQKQLDPLLDTAWCFDELEAQAPLIKALHAKKPSAEDVEILCRFYVKRPWGKQHPFTRSESSYLRELDENQLAMVRDKLLHWGPAALPVFRDFLEKDRKILADRIAQLDKDDAYWQTQRARLRGLPLTRIGRERVDTKDIRTELRELVNIIECASAKKLSSKQVEQLCRTYTRRGWASQNEVILDLLKKAGPTVLPIIISHVAAEKEALGPIQEEIETCMPKVSSTGTRWRYNHAMKLRKNISEGIAALEEISK